MEPATGIALRRLLLVSATLLAALSVSACAGDPGTGGQAGTAQRWETQHWETQRWEGSQFPVDEVAETKANARLLISVRLEWKNQSMTYWVGPMLGGVQQDAETSIPAGDLASLRADRTVEGTSKYQQLHRALVDSITSVHARLGNTAVKHIAICSDVGVAGAPGKDTPWGFVTLAVDAATEYNKSLPAERRLSITFLKPAPVSASTK